MSLWSFASSLWYWMTAGLASASRCRMARAASYDVSANSGLPVCFSTTAILLWLIARNC